MQEIYEAMGSPLLDGVLEGFNATIFAYGQVGSHPHSAGTLVIYE